MAGQERNFDWDLLRSFLAVARAGTLTTAARRLKIDHSTLGRRIAALEHALGLKLFDRSLSGYRLTPEGEQMLARAEAMEQYALALSSELAEVRGHVAGTVRIGAPDGFGSVFLAAHIGRLIARYPDLEIELVATPRHFNLGKREADLAIGLSGQSHARLRTSKLTDYVLGLYGAVAHPALHAGLKTPADLAGRPMISYIDDLIFTPELDYLPALADGLQVPLKSSNLLAQWQATVSGAGLCILPAFLADQDPRLVRLLPQEISLIRSFYLSRHAGSQAQAAIRVTADFIEEIVAERRALFLPPTGPVATH